MSLQAYHEKFIALADVIDQAGISLVDPALVTKIATANARPLAPIEAGRTAAKDQASPCASLEKPTRTTTATGPVCKKTS